MGCPIRKFTDQSLFAAPHDLSQRTTSFIASQHQGIHRIPLRHLIALIIDAHHTLIQEQDAFLGRNPSGAVAARLVQGWDGPGLDLKDQFASNIPEDFAVKQKPTD